MNSRKKLQTMIHQTELEVKQKQIKIATHKQYFSQLVNDHKVVLLAMLLPAFMTGWKMARAAKSGQLIKQFARYCFFTVASYIPKL